MDEAATLKGIVLEKSLLIPRSAVMGKRSLWTV